MGPRLAYQYSKGLQGLFALAVLIALSPVSCASLNALVQKSKVLEIEFGGDEVSPDTLILSQNNMKASVADLGQVEEIRLTGFEGNHLVVSSDLVTLIKIELRNCPELEVITLSAGSGLKNFSAYNCPRIDLDELFEGFVNSEVTVSFYFQKCGIPRIPENLKQVPSVSMLQVVSNGTPVIVPMEVFWYENLKSFNHSGTKLLLEVDSVKEIRREIEPSVNVFD